MAVRTGSTTSSGGIWKTPKPIWGIAAPVLRVTVRTDFTGLRPYRPGWTGGEPPTVAHVGGRGWKAAPPAARLRHAADDLPASGPAVGAPGPGGGAGDLRPARPVDVRRRLGPAGRDPRPLRRRPGEPAGPLLRRRAGARLRRPPPAPGGRVCLRRHPGRARAVPPGGRSAQQPPRPGHHGHPS